ncbi:F-box protein At5g07610-like [Cornus florida]|uniref:F-box protein At5g07610-like n=1 Tax=Cornus florida TaxID=4283 RepID=UPI00289912D5|nr:F-box protein At5g07610-like [Cornus florida]
MGSTAAAEIIGGNKDLAVEILRHLPAKSLIRFKLVSKAWLSLISTPRFSLLLWQSHRHPKVSGLFFNTRPRTETIKYIPLTPSGLRNQCDITTVVNGGEENNSPPLFPDMSTTIIDSCNGFLLYFTKQQHFGSWMTYSYHVYNPSTKQLATLPWPFTRTFPFLGDFLYLVFDPLKSLHYKVVLVQASEHGNDYLYQIHIYSSETNDWRRSPLDDIGSGFHPFLESLNSVDLNKGVYCNGSIHWISYRAEETSLYFDVDQEIFCPMPSPPYNAVGFKFWHFGESRGHLHFITDMGFNVNVSEMESDYSKWTMKFRVCLNAVMVDLALEEEMVVRSDTALSLIHGEDEGDVFLVLYVRTEMNYMIISYNIKENTFKKLGDVPSHPASFGFDDLMWHRRKYFSIYRYIETLFSI